MSRKLNSTKVENIEQKYSLDSKILLSKTATRFPLPRILEWIGPVSEDNLNRVLTDIKDLMQKNHNDITLVINSHGGPTGYGMTFFDMVRVILRAPLTTIGTGDVDSSGIIVYLSGQKRILTKNTTMFFHVAGRRLDGRRITTADMRAMLKEDVLKDHHYASVVAKESGGKLTTMQVLEMMRKNSVLSSTEALELGLADEVV